LSFLWRSLFFVSLFLSGLNNKQMNRLLLWGSFFLGNISLFAQTAPTDTLLTNDLAEITVRSAKDLSDRKFAPSPKLVFTSKDFERFELTTIGDYLRSLPGVVITQGNESKDIRFRGLDKEYTQILIDGERMPDGGEKREFNVDRIPLNMVERIEILRSPTANVDAQGSAGTINIILKKAGGAPTLRFNGSVGQVGEFGNVADGYVQYGGKIGNKLNFMLNGGYQTRIVPKDKRTESFKKEVLSSYNDDLEIKKYSEANFAPRLNWKINAKHILSLDPLYLFSKEDKNNEKDQYSLSAGKFVQTNEDTREVKDREGWSLRGTYTFKPSEKFDLTFRPIFQDYQEVKDKTVLSKNAENVQTKKATETEDKSDKETLNRLTANVYAKNQHWAFGVESGIKLRNKDKAVATNDVPGARGAKDYYEAEEIRWNSFLINDISLGKHIISPALRWEITDLTSVSQFLNAKKELQVVERKHHFQTLNPILNYVWRATKELNIRASGARTVRRPKFDDLTPYIETKAGTLLNPDTQGNPDLLPETSVGVDLGADYFFGRHNEVGVVGLNFFRRNIHDFMENQTNLDPIANRYVTQVSNAGDGKVWGVEVDFRYEMGLGKMGRLIPKVNGSWLDSKLLDNKTKQYRKFRGQPDYVYNIGFEYLTNNKRFSLGANYNEVPVADEAETKNDGSYEVKEVTSIRRLDLFVNYTLTQKLMLRLGGQNLLTKAKTVYKRVYLPDNSLSSYDIERETFSPTYMLSMQWNIR